MIANSKKIGAAQIAATTTLVLLIALVTVGIAAHDASAGDFVVKPCSTATPPFAPTWIAGDGSAWHLEDHCPEGLELINQAPAVSSESPMISTFYLAGIALKSATVTMTGSNGADRGIAQGLQVCGPYTCGKLATVSGDNVTSPETVTLTLANGGIPAEGAAYLKISATCLPNPLDADAVMDCGWGDGMSFKSIELTGTDSTPPDLAGYLSDSEDPLPSPSPWRNAVMTFYGSATDIESGIESVSLSVPGYLGDGCLGKIDDYFPQLCPSQVSAQALASPEDFPDGPSTLTLTAKNAAGLSASTNVVVRFDKTPPAQPTELTAHPNSHGWNNSEFVTLDWNNPVEKLETATESGIVAAKYKLEPIAAGYAGDPIEQTVQGANIHSLMVDFPASGTWNTSVSTVDAVGNVSPPRTGVVRVDTERPFKPTLAAISPINAANASAGKTLNWSINGGGSNASGICEFKYAINDLAGFEPTTGPGVQTVEGVVSQAQLSAPGILALGDGNLTVHLRAVSCAGLDGPTDHASMRIDRALPRIFASPESGWLTAGESVSLNANDGAASTNPSGIDSISYWIDGDSAHTTKVSSSTAQVPIQEGSHTITYFAKDSAGNQSVSKELTVGVDSDPPVAQFAAVDPAHPTSIRAHASDSASGVSQAWIEFQSPGSSVWQRLDTAPVSGKEGYLAAEFRDDDAMASGTYQLRVVAQDLAGNASVATQRIDGSKAALTLPLRPRPVLSAKLSTSAKSVPQSSALTVDFGATTQLGGFLTTAAGAPLAGAALNVYATPEGGSRVPVGTVSTDAAGRYRLVVPAGVSRELSVRFSGSETIGPATAAADVTTRAKITFKLSRSVVRSGVTTRLRGKIYSGAATIPPRGKRLEIQFKVGGHWSDASISARTATDGSFSIPFSRSAKKAPIRFVMRAVAITESGWPYAEGDSKTLALRVTP